MNDDDNHTIDDNISAVLAADQSFGSLHYEDDLLQVNDYSIDDHILSSMPLDRRADDSEHYNNYEVFFKSTSFNKKMNYM